jgi:HEAT repeat protein
MTPTQLSDNDLRKLLAALRHPSAETRAAACFRLEAWRDSRAIDPLIEVLRDSREDPLVRNAAAGALEAIGGPRVLARLLEVMADAPINDWRAVFSLASLGEPAVEPLLAILNNPAAAGRAHAAAALGLINDPRAIGPLVSALQGPDPVLRSRAATALGRLRDPRVFDFLAAALRDPKPHVRRDAMWALSELGDKRAVGLIVRALRDPSRYTRKLAAECLGEMGSQPAVNELERIAATDKQPRVARAARLASDQIQQQIVLIR